MKREKTVSKVTLKKKKTNNKRGKITDSQDFSPLMKGVWLLFISLLHKVSSSERRFDARKFYESLQQCDADMRNRSLGVLQTKDCEQREKKEGKINRIKCAHKTKK